MVTNVVNIFFILLHCLILYTCFKRNSTSLFYILVGLFSTSWGMLSICYLEMGAFSLELNQLTFATGATIRYSIVMSIFLVSYWKIFNYVTKIKFKIIDAKVLAIYNKYDHIVIFMSSIYVLIYFFITPFDLTSGENDDVESYPLTIRILQYFNSTVMFVLGWYASVTKKQKTRLTIYVIVFFLLLIKIKIGNKFGLLLSMTGYFIIPFVTLNKLNLVNLSIFGVSFRNQVKIYMITIFIMMLLATNIFVNNIGADFFEYLFARLLIYQGGVWWITDPDVNYGNGNLNINELKNFMLSSNYHKNSVLFYLMSNAIGASKAYHIFFVNNSLYTGAFPSVFYIFGGKYGVFIIPIIYGIILGVTSGYLCNKIVKMQMLRAIVAFTIFLPFVLSIESGEFLQLYSTNIVIKFLVAIMLELALKEKHL